MTRDKITYAGVDYPVRIVNGHIFATEALQDALFDEHVHYVDMEAELTDDTICYYLTETEYETLTDEDIIKFYLPQTEEEEGVAPKACVDGYSIFLMVNLAKQFGLIEFEQEYDLQWAEGWVLYEDFSGSSFNDEGVSEYEAIVNFLKQKQNG